jgi:hypothetical protein
MVSRVGRDSLTLPVGPIVGAPSRVGPLSGSGHQAEPDVIVSVATAVSAAMPAVLDKVWMERGRGKQGAQRVVWKWYRASVGTGDLWV